MYEVIKVNPLNDYRILLEFNNGEQHIKDMKLLHDKPVFRILKDVSYLILLKSPLVQIHGWIKMVIL